MSQCFHAIGPTVPTRPAVITPALTSKEAQALVQSLLKNVYRAFDFRKEDHVYDKLALTVTGDLLNEIYLQNRKSLEIQKAGGAQAKIKKVEVLSVSAKSHPTIPHANDPGHRPRLCAFSTASAKRDPNDI